jgi:hypothetical protein
VDRMNPLNAAFLELEDADQNASLAIAPIAILEGPPPSYEQRRSSTCRRGSDRDGLGLIPTSPLRNRRGGLASRGCTVGPRPRPPSIPPARWPGPFTYASRCRAMVA